MRYSLLQCAKLSIIGALVVAGCGGAPTSDSASGSVSLALGVEVGGIQYRLREAVFDVEGPASLTLTTEDDPDATVLHAELPAGSYSVTLQEGWRLERGTEGEFQTVEAQLLTENPLPFFIQAGVPTSARFRFASGGTPIGPEAPTNLVDVLGFEDATLWSSSAQLSLSDVRVQALHSLAVQGGGFHSISSVPLGAFPLTGDTVTVAIRLSPEQPNPSWFGDVQLLLDAPSLGLVEHSVGVIGLTGLPVGEFVDLDFSLSQSTLDALDGDFDDLVIRLALNVPADALGTYRFDNLRFGGVSACDFTCAAGTCVEGICEIPCPADIGNCDGDASNGCETPLTADSSNCGACGVQCAPGSLCQSGNCVASPGCAENEADCDGDPGNLCEVDVSTNAEHCGGCGMACGAGQTCLEGLCLAGDLNAAIQVTSDWGAGYCANVLLTNVGGAPTNHWEVTLDPEGASLSPWNANTAQAAGSVTLTPLSWNAVIAPGATDQSVGFCATRSGGNAVATIISVLP